MGKIKLTFSVFFLIFSFSFPASLTIQGNYFRKVDNKDKGTIHIFLYNNSSNLVKIEKIYYNGEELIDMTNDYCIWYQTTLPIIEPNQFADLKIKLRYNTNKLIRIGFTDTEGGGYEKVIEPKVSNIKICGAYFDNQLQTLYFYLQNISTTVSTIKKIYLNRKDITDYSYIPQKTIHPEEKVPVIIKMKEKITSGEYIYLEIETDNEKIPQLIRAYSFLVIQGYGGDTREELYFNKERFDFDYREEEIEKFKSLPEYKACHIFDDPACGDGIKNQLLGTNAKEIIRRTEKFYQYDKIHPIFLYGCEHMKPDNYFIYADVVDIFVVDPYEIVNYHKRPEEDAYYVSLAKLACEPKILWTIPEAFAHLGRTRFQTPEEEKIIVWSEIGEGSKGIWYFVYDLKVGYPANKQLEEEIKKINWELQKLKDYIVISEPFKLAKTEIEKITPYTLLCGDKGIVLILINNDHQSFFEQDKQPFIYTPKENFKVKVNIPDWLKVKEVKEIRYQEEKKIEYKIEENKLVIPIDTLDVTRQFLIITERK